MATKVTYTTTCGRCNSPVHIDAYETTFIVLAKRCECGKTVYGTYSAPGSRSHQKTVDLHKAIHQVFAAIQPPMTVRQVYYQLTTRHAVEKTEAGYNRVQVALAAMRRNGSIPYNYIADNSRSFYQARTYADMNTALADMHDYYRRDLWAAQDAHVEIWLEKRSLISQLNPVCTEFGVRLYPCGGYSSISFAYEAAMDMREIDKPIYIYHLSDLDADGAYSSIVLERELRTHVDGFHFQRLALTPAQVAHWRLYDAQREQKRTSARYGWWLDTYGADMLACELDAIHPDDLRNLVRQTIVNHIDPWNWENLLRIEKLEKESLRTIMDTAATA